MRRTKMIMMAIMRLMGRGVIMKTSLNKVLEMRPATRKGLDQRIRPTWMWKNARRSDTSILTTCPI